MPQEDQEPVKPENQSGPDLDQIPDAAKRALKEAEERRAKLAKESSDPKKEINGRGGLDPARYGDWEKKGIAVDF